jgi:hypothetical protein
LVADCIPGADCQVDGWIYGNHHRRVPTPYDNCNTCRCDDGELTECTTKDCAQIGCAEGHYAARTCRECGPTGGCTVLETGCFADASCVDGTCSSGCF